MKIEERRARLLGLNAPEALAVTLSKRLDAGAEITAQAITTALERLSLPSDRMAYARSRRGRAGGRRVARADELRSGIGPDYVDGGVMYVDGPPGSGLRYRVAATENQPGERADVPALLPASAADPDEPEDADWNRHEIEIFEAEIAEE